MLPRKGEIDEGLRLLTAYQRSVFAAQSGSLVGLADSARALQAWMLDHAEQLLASALKAASLTLPFTSGYQAGLRRAQELAKEHVALKHYHADENGKAYSFDWAEYDAKIEEELSR